MIEPPPLLERLLIRRHAGFMPPCRRYFMMPRRYADVAFFAASAPIACFGATRAAAMRC